MKGHHAVTHHRCALSSGTLLVLHDTCEFTYHRNKESEIGVIGYTASGKNKAGRPIRHTIRGVLMHSSLVITPEGLPLGLAAIKFLSRKKFKGCNARKRKINPTRVPIEEKESARWIENISQDPEIRLQGTRIATAHIAAPGEPVGSVLYHQLAHLLDDHAPEIRNPSARVPRLYENGNYTSDKTVRPFFMESLPAKSGGVHRIADVQASKQGNTSIMAAYQDLYDEFRPVLVVLIGIAFAYAAGFGITYRQSSFWFLP